MENMLKKYLTTVTAYKELESGKLGEYISYIIYSDGEIRYISCALKK